MQAQDFKELKLPIHQKVKVTFNVLSIPDTRELIFYGVRDRFVDFIYTDFILKTKAVGTRKVNDEELIKIFHEEPAEIDYRVWQINKKLKTLSIPISHILKIKQCTKN